MIFVMGEKFLWFLCYFIFSSYDVDVLWEDEIYGWLIKNEVVCGYVKNFFGFVKELVLLVFVYCYFFLGKD